MRQSIRIPFLHLLGWVAASAAAPLIGCREGKEDHLASVRPEKVVLAERSEDLRALIAKELAAGNKRIVIPHGRYRVQAERGSHLLFSNLSDVEIIAENVELENCRGMRLEDITEEEKAFIRKLRLDERIRTGLLEGEAKYYKLTLDREVALPPGSALCCPLRVGNGFAVKDCDFGHNRSRGILIKAGNGEVSANRITNSRMAAVLVSPEFWWMEAGCSSDLVIKNNTIKGNVLPATPPENHPAPAEAILLENCETTN